MGERGFDFLRLKPTVKYIIELVKLGRLEMAYENYKTMTMDLVETYWSDYARN